MSIAGWGLGAPQSALLYVRREVATIPNGFTTIRFVIGCVIAFTVAHPVVTFAFALVGSITDFFDGYLARKQQDAPGMVLFDQDIREFIPARQGQRHVPQGSQRLSA